MSFVANKNENSRSMHSSINASDAERLVNPYRERRLNVSEHVMLNEKCCKCCCDEIYYREVSRDVFACHVPNCNCGAQTREITDCFNNPDWLCNAERELGVVVEPCNC